MDCNRSEVTETLDAYPKASYSTKVIPYIHICTSDFILNLDNIDGHASGCAAFLIVRVQDEVCLPHPSALTFLRKVSRPSVRSQVLPRELPNRTTELKDPP